MCDFCTEYGGIVIEDSACRTKIYCRRREIDIVDANRPNFYEPVHFVAIIRIPCHFGGAYSMAMHHRPRDGYLSIETGRNRGKYTSIYITAGCWLVTLSRTADDSMICRSATVPCQIWPSPVLASALTRRTPVPSFIRGDRRTNARIVTLDYQSAAIVMRPPVCTSTRYTAIMAPLVVVAAISRMFIYSSATRSRKWPNFSNVLWIG